MEIKNIIIASAVVAIVGLIIAILLSVAEKIFHVEVDEKEIKIRQALAGNNCGACGYAGCDALAKAIAKGEAPVKPIVKPKPIPSPSNIEGITLFFEA